MIYEDTCSACDFPHVLCTYRLGQPGVELTGVHDDVNKVLQILPFASEVCVTLCVRKKAHYNGLPYALVVCMKP